MILILISDVGISEVEMKVVMWVFSFNAVEVELAAEAGGDDDEEEPLVVLSRKGKTFPRWTTCPTWSAGRCIRAPTESV